MNACPTFPFCTSFHIQFRQYVPARKALMVMFFRTKNIQCQPYTEGIDTRHTNTMKSTRDLVRIFVELPTSVQGRKRDLTGWSIFLGMHIDWNPATIVSHDDVVVRLKAYIDGVAVAR